MIENIRTHPYTRAVCFQTARLFERRAAKNLVEAQRWADEGASDRAREFQTKARLAQERAPTRGTYGQEMPLPTTSREGMRHHDRGI